MNHINGKETLKELVNNYPYLVDLINSYRLDYTFSPETPLEEAIAVKSLSLDTIIGEINLAIDEYKVSKPDII